MMPRHDGITGICITPLSELDKKSGQSGRLFSIVCYLVFTVSEQRTSSICRASTIALAFKVSIIELSVCFFSSSAIRLLNAVS
jgi:hypothetical protein